jgi:4-alpha-glucanotransferase
MMRLAWESVAALAIAPLQDLLNLGTDARMNVPGRAEGNWRWRCTEEMLSTRAFDWLRQLTELSDRSNLMRRTTTDRSDAPGPSPGDRLT